MSATTTSCSKCDQKVSCQDHARVQAVCRACEKQPSIYLELLLLLLLLLLELDEDELDDELLLLLDDDDDELLKKKKKSYKRRKGRAG
jgi:hypothetical protein